MAFRPAGLPTGIGSMPYRDAEKALSLIFSSLPEIPHWPQMPMLGAKEGLAFQFLTPLVNTGLIYVENGRALFDSGSESRAEKLADFYSVYMAAVDGDREALEKFALPRDSARGFYSFADHIQRRGPGDAVFFKGQIAGPLTVGFQVKDETGRLAYYDEQMRDLLVKTIALSARWQAARLAELGRPPVIFVDEPAIGVYGNSNYITITREMIESDLNEIFDQIHLAGGLAGVHSCDAMDWSILYGCSLEIVNLDAYNFADSLLPFAAELKYFLSRDGILALGLVPTSEKILAENKESLVRRLENLLGRLENKGVPRKLILKQSMITPSCGTGLLDPALAERIYGLTGELSAAARRLAAG